MIKFFVTNFADKYFYKDNSTYFLNDFLKKYNRKSTYFNLLKRTKENNKEFTSKKVYDTNNLKFGITNKEARKITKNREEFIKKELVYSTVLIQKTIIGDYHAKLALHFHKNSLFLFNYTFSNLDKKDKKIIKNILKEKYLNNNDLSFDFSSDNIVDDVDNYIIIEDDVYFTIHYISPNHHFFNFLSEEKIKIEQKIIEKENLKKTELLNKL